MGLTAILGAVGIALVGALMFVAKWWGAAVEKKKQLKKNVEAVEDKKEITHEVENLSDDELRDRLDKFVR